METDLVISIGPGYGSSTTSSGSIDTSSPLVEDEEMDKVAASCNILAISTVRSDGKASIRTTCFVTSTEAC